MDGISDQQQATELLQKLGLKEYEAKCFVALTRLPQATAKEISEISEVPRTRVYDAIRVLEAKGLVEVQHVKPQVFRAVTIDEAADTLRKEYETQIDSLRESLRGMEPATSDGAAKITQEIWAMDGRLAIANRARQLVDNADEEIVLVVGHADTFDSDLATHLHDAIDRGVSVIVGAVSEDLRETIQEELLDSEVFVSGLEWLSHSKTADDTTEISRLMLVDRSVILMSTFTTSETESLEHEQAVFGRGFDNGLVTIGRRLMATGLLPRDDPGVHDSVEFDGQ